MGPFRSGQMHRFASSQLSLVLCAVLAAPSAALSAAASDSDSLRVTVAQPRENTSIGSDDGRVLVTGRVLSRSGRAQQFDVVIVIDTSFSTHAPSGADVDGDGRIGQRLLANVLPPIAWLMPMGNTDAGDSILAAEIEAARTLVEQLDPRTTRVGVVAFAGDKRDDTRDARTVVPLTNHYASVARGLRILASEGPGGRTNMYDAVEVAAAELSGSGLAISTPRPDPEEGERIILFMTDGRPTLPVVQAPGENARLAITAARRAKLWDIRIDTFAIGRDATDEPVVTVEMAAVTGGLFTPVRNPRDLIAVFEKIRLASIERVQVQNLTTGASAEHVLVDPDGSFSAMVVLRDGENLLEVRAVDSQGVSGQRRVPVRLVAGIRPRPLSARIEARRLRLLENQLRELQRRNLVIEVKRDESLRRRLELEIASARDRRARLRGLEIAVDDTD